MYKTKHTPDWFAEAILSMDESLEVDDFSTEDVLYDAADTFLNELAKHHDPALLDRRLELAGFYRRFHNRWQRAFDTLEFVVQAHEEAGVLFKSYHDLKFPTDEEKTYEYSALILLHARACQVAREVLVLITAGYADGAMARWRALYEMATVAEFIREHGEETAERFLKYRVVETYKQGRKYEEHYEELGFEPLEDDALDRLSEQVDKLTDKYGNSYYSNWGWAEQDLEEDAHRGEVAKQVGTVKFSPFYAMASNSVHGGSKGSQERLALRKSVQETLLPLGPQEAGFTDPAQLTSLMLHRVTAALLELGEDPHWTAVTEALEQIAHEVPGAFVADPFETAIKESSEEIAEVIVDRVKQEIKEREDIDGLGDLEVDNLDIDDILEDIFGWESTEENNRED